MKAHRYARAPFSGKGWHGNHSDEPMCGICGRIVKGGTFEDGWTLWSVVVDGGASWGDEHSDESDPGYMGWFPIGKDCHKRHVIRGGASKMINGWNDIGRGISVHVDDGKIDRVDLDERYTDMVESDAIATYIFDQTKRRIVFNWNDCDGENGHQVLYVREESET